jgi:hypothetical protein
MSGAVETELILRRRRVGPEDLDLIRRLIAEEGQRGRSHISNRLCELWDWRQANGLFRQIACRDLLRQLHAKGLIALPPELTKGRRQGYTNRFQLPDLFSSIPLEGALNRLGPRITLQRVQSRPQRQLFNGLIGSYHYVGYQQPTGAQLKYLAFFEDRPIACLSFGPAAYKVAARDQFLGWTVAQRQQRLPWLVNNDRFLILPFVRIPRLASWLLSRCLRRLRTDWQQVYQHDLALAETFIEENRFEGTCYAAANWLCLGKTQGRGRNDRFNEASLPIKTIWVYPLRKDFRQVLRASE